MDLDSRKYIGEYVRKLLDQKMWERSLDSSESEKEAVSNFKETSLIQILVENYATQNLDQETVIQQIQAFIIAGTDTTAYALNSGLHFLGNNFKLQAELREEINSVFPENVKISEFDVAYEDIHLFPKVLAFVKETLRLSPSLPLALREGPDKQRDPTCFGVKLEMAVPYNSVHTDPRFWKNPKKFDITRWLKIGENSTQNFAIKLPHHNSTTLGGEYNFCYLPFSAGKRNCIGQKFALNNLVTSVVYILKFYKLESTTSSLEFINKGTYKNLNSFVKFRTLKKSSSFEK